MKETGVLVRRLRRGKKRIATTNGCFDLLHRGHLALLKTAAGAGDTVIVGINSDRSVRKAKGDTRPVRSQRARAELLLDLPWVDYVVIEDAQDSVPIVEVVQPDIHVNDSYYGADCIEKKPVEEGGGKILVVPMVKCESTTDLIKKILKKHS